MGVLNMDNINILELWENAQKFLRKDISEVSYNTWIKNLKPIEINNEKLIVEVPNEFTKAILEQKYEVLIANALGEAMDNNIKVSYIVASIPQGSQQKRECIGLKHAKEMRQISNTAKEKVVDISNEASKELTKISRRMESLAELGKTEITYAIDAEIKGNKEIYELVIEKLYDMGYTIEEYDMVENNMTIQIKW